MSPLISVVVPTYQQAGFIEQTLASITGQGWPRLELIVVDGGSEDGTREIVERYPVTHFISEKDRGQSEAINKGFRLAKGDILAWLNSDDYYLPLTLARIAAVLGHDPAPRLVYGDCLYWYEARDQAQVMRGRPYDCDLLRRNCYLIQPSTFWTRALWEKTGGVNEDLHFTMDWEWFLRARSHGRFEWLNQVLSVYRFHPAHKTSGRHGRRGDEILRLIEQHGDPAWLPVFRDVHARLPGLIRTWDRFTLHGRYRLHKLRHWDLYLKHGPKLEEAFFQLHV